jgi:hypothetical protein
MAELMSLEFLGTNPKMASSTVGQLPGKHNFLAGPVSNWRQALPGFRELRYRNIYPGINLIYHGAQGRPSVLEYDLQVMPGADVSTIRLRFGEESRINSDGELILAGKASSLLRWSRPVAYQVSERGRKIIPARYVLRRDKEIGFQLGAYDHTVPLVIDPALAYSQMLPTGLSQMRADPSGAVYLLLGSTLMKIQSDGTPGYTTTLPASMQQLFSLAVDAGGSVYLTGQTGGNLPTTSGALQTSYGGGAQDAFVAKLAPGGGSFQYVTYFGGPNGEGGTSIAVDSLGNAYLAGYAIGTGLPTTVGAFKTAPDNPPDTNLWTAKINASGSQLDYSTFVGDLGNVLVASIGVDPSSASAVLAGNTTVATFPATPGAYNDLGGVCCGAFVTKIKADGSGLTYSARILGAEISALAVDASGDAYVVGLGDPQTTPGAYQTVFPGAANSVAFVTKLDPSGATLLYSTFLDISQCFPHACVNSPGIVVDSTGSAYVGGSSRTPNAPVVNPVQAELGDSEGNGFVVILNPNGSDASFATYFGGGFLDIVIAIDLDSHGNIYLAGQTSGNSFPFTSGSQPGGANSFIARIAPSGGPVGVFVPPFNSSMSSYSASAMQFDSTLVGTSAASQTLVFGNYGGATLNISGVSVSGDFSQTNNCPNALQPGASCQLVVGFTPTATGTRSGSLVIRDDAGGGSQQSALAGTGIAPAVGLAPSSLSFASQTVGSSSAPQTITVTNLGTANLSISAIATQGDFSQTNTCGSALAPQTTCTIAVTFTPSASGLRTGTLTLTDNASDSPQSLPLAGNTSFSLATAAGSSASATISAGQTAHYTLSLIPSAGFAGTVMLTCAGAPAAATCSVPASVQVDSSAPATVNVSVSTTSHTAGALQHPGFGYLSWAWAVSMMGIALAPGRDRLRRSARRYLGLIVLALLVFVGGCGGGGSSHQSPNGTPAGSYTLMVTASSGSASQSISLALTVQ